MGDYFDDDDLINDYMEEDEGPPDEMIDEKYYIEECEAPIELQPKVTAAAAATVFVQPNEESEEVHAAISDCLSEEIAISRRRMQDYLYSFERYENLESSSLDYVVTVSITYISYHSIFLILEITATAEV